MALEPAAISELIKKLDQDRTVYFATLSHFQETPTPAISAFNQALGTSSTRTPSQPLPTSSHARSSSLDPNVLSHPKPPRSFCGLTSNKKASHISTEAEESSDSDDDESFLRARCAAERVPFR